MPLLVAVAFIEPMINVNLKKKKEKKESHSQ